MQREVDHGAAGRSGGFWEWCASLRDVPWLRWPALVLYYAALILALVRLYGPAHHAPPPPFIYQGF